MKFCQLQLNIFKNLLNLPQFKIDVTTKVGRPKIKDHINIFKSILFKVKTGVNWEDTKLYGNFSISTVYKYFKLWCSNYLFEQLFFNSLKAYSKAKRINWKFQAIDSTIIKAYRGGEAIGPNSTDRGRNGTKIHTLVDKKGIPLAFYISKANIHDSQSVEHLINNYVLRRPYYEQYINLDTAYDSKKIKTFLTSKKFIYQIPKNKRNSKKEVPKMSDSEKQRYKNRLTVEHQFGHLKQYKSIILRYTRKAVHFTNIINIAYSMLITKKI